MPSHHELLISLFNYLGVFAFGISGAVAALRRRVDLFGAVVLGFVAACSGGILRDILIGALPPDNIRSWVPLAVSSASALFTLVFYQTITRRLQNPVQIFDALGLGLFAVLGAEKALVYGIGAVWAIILGAVTSIGGGMMRDILLARVPTVLRAEIYATAALAGAAIFVAGKELALWPDAYGIVIGAGSCTLIRLLALYRKWQLPLAGGHERLTGRKPPTAGDED